DACPPDRAHRRWTLRTGVAARAVARAPHGGAVGDGREFRVAQPHQADARGLLRRAGDRPRRDHDAPRSGGRAMRATASIAINVFRESVRDKVLYNLVLFAILMIGASF